MPSWARLQLWASNKDSASVRFSIARSVRVLAAPPTFLFRTTCRFLNDGLSTSVVSSYIFRLRLFWFIHLIMPSLRQAYVKLTGDVPLAKVLLSFSRLSWSLRVAAPSLVEFPIWELAVGVPAEKHFRCQVTAMPFWTNLHKFFDCSSSGLTHDLLPLGGRRKLIFKFVTVVLYCLVSRLSW